MRIHFELTVEPPRLTRPRRPRTLIALGALAMALVLPAVALASHMFGDVPGSHPQHQAIARVANAGVMGGCGGGNFCPDQDVNKGRLAGILNRGLGRVAEADIHDTAMTGFSTSFGSVTITPGTAGAGDTQFVHAQFNGSLEFTDDSQCPCAVSVTLRRGDTWLSEGAVMTSVPIAGELHAISTGGVIAVTGGGPVTIELRASVTRAEHPDATVEYNLGGNLVATTIPFGSTGGSTLSP